MAKKIVITDCDHVSFDEERKVCEDNGFEFVKLQLASGQEDETAKALKGVEVVGNQYLKFTDSLFDKLPNLKCIVRYGVGVDNVDIPSATKHGVAVCNVPDYGSNEVASHAFAMMLALTRKLKIMDRSVEQGYWNYELSVPITRYSELTVGVIGFGRIGRAFAKMAHDFGCKVCAFDVLFPPTLSSSEREKYGIPQWTNLVNLEDIFKNSDVISLHAPLTKENGGCVSEKQLKMMKKTSYLINVSRGGLVNEPDLYKALVNGDIAGAAIDTWMSEPTQKDNPLIGLENFIATPHMAWYSVQSSSDLKRKLAEECARALNGEPLKYQLNK